MSANASLYAYEDCYELLDRALEATTGVRAKARDQGEAYQFKTRLHQARKLSRLQAMQVHPDPSHPEHGKSVYDDLVVSLKQEGNDWWIYISRRRAPLVVEELPNEDINDNKTNSRATAGDPSPVSE